MKLRSFIHLRAIAGFGVAAGFAAAQGWSLPEFCWSTWLGGLVFTWLSILAAVLRGILRARASRAGIEGRVPFLRRVPADAFVIGASVVALGAGWLAFRVYGFVFGFYGLFLSVFARMEPESLFGPNGFINSDFYSPVVYLLERFWPTALGVVIAHGDEFLGRQPWRSYLSSLGREVLRLHILILALPILSLLAWFLLGDRFQTLTILLLMGVLYLVPGRSPREAGGHPEKDPPRK